MAKAEADDVVEKFSSDEEDAFEDAPETVPVSSEVPDLDQSVEDCMIGLNLFLNNRFAEAKARMQPWAHASMYHSLGFGTIMYLQATMTFEQADINAAVVAVKKAIQVCNKFRKKHSMLSMSKPNYNTYTTVEIHAEVCYAECLIERALLTFIQDENLISFVKGSLKIRACHISYKECARILEKRAFQDGDYKIHFESGVRMGVGLFNLMISLLPSKILKLLEFVGFSGNKQKGMTELEKGAALEKSMRGPLCSMALLGYHTVVTYVLGTADGDIAFAEELLKPCLAKYPKGALFLFFAGRIEEIKGNVSQAIVRFEESVDSQEEWRQFHHLCFWELMWCHSFQGDWLLAMKYAEKLCRESKWSRATYTYQKAAFLLMCDDQTDETQQHINYLLGEVPKLKQRVAGKSIPIEKFAVKKAKRFLEQGNRLTLAAYEMIYVWNGFSIIGKKEKLLEPILNVVEDTINIIQKNKKNYTYFFDDYALALLLKGVCLRHKGQHFQAEQCFKEVVDLDKSLKTDQYLVPYALMEHAMLFIENNKLTDAKTMLDKAKRNHKGYSLESRLHFRIHAANLRLKASQDPHSLNGENSSVDGLSCDTPAHSLPPSASATSPAVPPAPTATVLC